MCARPRFAQVIFSAAANHFATKVDEVFQYLFQFQDARLAVNDSEIDHPERGLHRRELEQFVLHDLRHGVAFQLDHDAHAVTIRFVADFRDAFQLLFICQLSDALDQLGLVNLKWKFSDDHGVSLMRAAADAIDRGPGAHLENAAAGAIGLFDFFPPADKTAR